MLRCSRCKLDKPETRFVPDKRYTRGYGSWCKECKHEVSMEWRSRNKERYAAARNGWVKANWLRVKAEVFAAYGGKCSCPPCGETIPLFLAIDHINRDGKHHRRLVSGHVYEDLKKRGFPKEGFRLLCHNCNFATRYGKPCPHLETIEMTQTTQPEIAEVHRTWG